nr:ATP-binding cassette domain-containing protein [Anaerosporobacter sp.]
MELDDVINKLPNGLDTILDSSKTLLSGGQKQRLAIARVYLKKPKVLVFDESTSALDGNTELNLTNTWDELFKENTVLIIAHRLSTIMKADRVAFLENGKIIGCEKHTQLLETCLQYRTLFYEQYRSYCKEGGIV